MNTRDTSLQILQQVFGYSSYRQPQQQIIDTLVRGEDALVLMPTGGGKSLCYQIPALLRSGVGIVISPLIALMQDQVAALRQAGVAAGALNSALSAEEDARMRTLLRNGELQLLYVAPERLMTSGFQSLLQQIDIALFAIDEAHCVSQWGHDFRPEYIQLSALHENFPGVPRVALTATADELTRREIIQRLKLERARHFISGFDRPNIRYRVSDDSSNARQQLLRFIQLNYAQQAGIVYCLSRRKVEDTAIWLQKQGIQALPYHAGMSQQDRANHQDRFLREDGVVMVATIAFGMGIDKPDVRFVVHMNLPKSLEAYYQETGRAGRDGEPAEALLFYNLQDVITLRQFVEQSDADELHKRIETQKLERMLGYCELTSCRRQALLAYFGDVQKEACGNCDTCLNPPETWDGTVAAQKALSCVHHTGQRFGVNYLIDVLLGKNNERIQRFGHDRVSTFGIGTELDQKQWRSLFRQLIAQGYLAVDQEGHGGLRLSESCRPLLRGEVRLQLRRLQKEKSGKLRKQRTAYQGVQGALWEALRQKRLELAQEQGVPPYVIFHDATLMAMMEYQPQTLEQMSRISGVGERKLEAYGQAFLDLLADFDAEATLVTDTVSESLDLFRLGMDAENIARRRGLKVSTILGHLAKGIEQGLVELAEVITLEEELLASARELMLEQGEEIRLGPVHEALGGALDYGVLACIRADLNRRLES
ncbi:ATP-dependent DNA helicase RecQ [Thiolapillus brandeum]|uniref:DNA helicase RecQ n=2 Tax=Thiolapillus brandeum TaxID=1076588 RepID=A0A7U6JIA1_9GAMM|nr:ATP-dependent DNA helicase RecQ [Thiolapillus brandeum]